ncbi:Exodeoxyribonuclease I subunit D [Desulfosporosinus acidiphilus SJ4]|uniref:Nuclease SbcCD subunit D n=1 Tax=Desulfosporosinus acidiphilus (strain DSM 22704 / JCM 16185 / SJ4) TaxID=646529 RepID=I4D0G8_DESAJ|nr:exonuclease subunit SbcD [Desulfosporosinus acidiphilus]AFM39292.1 Exodeoxyribonuclease I subunit D [Desulfosporosinus acidiphilus SJ4]
MRILHTSDWHLGRMLEGRSRIEEQIKFIDELCLLVEDEGIDLVLIAGDIFDTVNPPAIAEELFYDALNRLTAGGTRGVVAVAGNHDNPERLCAASPLAVRQGITLYGLPKDVLTPSFPGYSPEGRVVRKAAGQGWVELQIPKCPDPVILTLLPYPSESRLNEVLNSSLDEESLRQDYSKRVQELFALFGQAFRPEAVNLAMSHLFVRGGMQSESERPIQLGSAPTVEVEAMPAGAQYVALGHLHRAQVVKGTLVPTRYSGSPLAYSFSETGYAKSVVLIEAFPGKPVETHEIFLSSGYPLVKWQAKEGLAQVQRWIDEGRDSQAWIDLEVHVTNVINPQDIHSLRRQRERLINIRPVFPETEQITSEARSKLPLDELFRKFYQDKTGGAEPDQELVSMFLSLIDQDKADSKRNVSANLDCIGESAGKEAETA